MSNLLAIEKFKFDSSNLTGSAQDFGTEILNPGLKIGILNDSDVACIVTVENAPISIEVPSKATVTFDEVFPKNETVGSKYYMAKGEQLQIVQVTAAGTGNIIAHVVEER